MIVCGLVIKCLDEKYGLLLTVKLVLVAVAIHHLCSDFICFFFLKIKLSFFLLNNSVVVGDESSLRHRRQERELAAK